ncbi:HAUS3 protein, partial [Turnix velox]|nr:HAUS3 protein [Turnix velox]
IMSCGNDFVETLKKIGYPKCDELNGEDFDWMFDSLEDRSFLEWFCRSVSEQNVVTEKELQDFNSLVESGKTILEGKALYEVLKTLKPVDSKSSSREEEEEEQRKLNDELQTRKKLRKLRVDQHDKLQMLISANSQALQTLKNKEEEAHKYLKEGLQVLTAASNKVNIKLQSLIDVAEKLTSLFTASASEQGSGSGPMFFSQLSLEKYLSLEEQSTAAFNLYMKKHFNQDMSEWVENSQGSKVQLPDTIKQITCDEADELQEESQEIARLQTAYICAQHQLIQMQAKEEGMNSAIRCAESMLESLNSEVGHTKQESLDAKISSLNDDISTLKQDITKINNEELLPLLKEKAQLFTLPVVKRCQDSQIAQQDYYAARQDEIHRHLLRQKASFDFIELAYEMEVKQFKEFGSQLENLVDYLKRINNALEQRQQVIAEQTQPAKPSYTISSKDGFACRLYELLEGEKDQQMFKTYRRLEQMAQQLKQDCAKEEEQIAASSQEQSLLLSSLKSEVDTLHDSLYHGGCQIELSSWELCEQFRLLEADLIKLKQLLIELIADIKSKKDHLESNKLLQTERKLYVYFVKDQDYLKELVENLERQVAAKAKVQED